MPLTFTENTSIDFDVHGEGPPLILIGGLGFGRWGWFKQVPAFSRHFQTITFDTRGERGLENGVADLVADVVALLITSGWARRTCSAPRSAASWRRSWRWSGRISSTG